MQLATPNAALCLSCRVETQKRNQRSYWRKESKYKENKKYKKNAKKMQKKCKEIEIRMQKFGTDSFIFTMCHYSPRPKASGIVTCIDFSRSLGELCNQFQDKRGYTMELWGPEIKISEKMYGWGFVHTEISGVILAFTYYWVFFGPTLVVGLVELRGTRGTRFAFGSFSRKFQGFAIGSAETNGVLPFIHLSGQFIINP